LPTSKKLASLVPQAVKTTIFFEGPKIEGAEDCVTTNQRLRAGLRISMPLILLCAASACTTAVVGAPQPGAKADPVPALAPDQQQRRTGTEALQKLCAERTGAKSLKDFTIGPGDLIQINVPGMDEFRNYQARVSPTGALEVPLAGTLQAGGLTEQALTDLVRKRLGEYVRNPDVEVLVSQYQSREVGVAGAVQKPGMFTLNGPSDTLLDVLSQAGGLAPTAANQIYFIPAQGTAPPLSAHSLANAQAVGNRTDVAVIDLSDPDTSKYMACPARPGDVLIAPIAGGVMVEGWVRQPGSFPITPRMTVLGAVDAAGGAMFSSEAHLLRGSASGDKTDTPLDLNMIESGKEPDIPVQSGDVVAVSSSTTGAVPYAIYFMLSRVTPGVGAFSGF
jgi:polysaccharide export outer membrane protein